MVIRYGGEEIIIGLPGTNLQAATNLVENPPAMGTDRYSYLNQNIRVTFSAGIADFTF